MFLSLDILLFPPEADFEFRASARPGATFRAQMAGMDSWSSQYCKQKPKYQRSGPGISDFG
jgi:hypothetical protein